MSREIFSDSRRRCGGRRPWRRRLVRAFGSTLIVLGLLALADAGVTMVWQEPISAVYASFGQHSLEGQLREVESAQMPVREQIELKRVHDEHKRVRLLAAAMERKASLGSAVGRIDIPRIESSFVLVDGTGTSELEKGPGIYSKGAYPAIKFPGVRGGVTAIAGHRTTYLEPFRRIDELRKGDRIVLTMPYGRFVYTVQGHRSVLPTDVAAALSPGHEVSLVLSACTPLFSAEKRWLVFARLTGVTPRGAAVIAPDKARVSRLGWPGKGLPALMQS